MFFFFSGKLIKKNFSTNLVNRSIDINYAEPRPRTITVFRVRNLKNVVFFASFPERQIFEIHLVEKKIEIQTCPYERNPVLLMHFPMDIHWIFV